MNNRRFARTAGWLALPCLVAAGLLAWYVTRQPASPFEQEQAAAASFDPALVSRGEYVARVSDCVACHSLPGKAPFAGGLEMATPLGAIHATNVTPDRDAGIGAYSLADFDRAVRQGVAPGGRRLYPAMPYPSYVKLSDDDMRALYAFFMKGVQPASQPNVPSDIPWPLNMRWPIALWNGLFAPTTPYAAKPAEDALWNRGAYIVQGPGHCGSCHTPRGLAFNEKALDESGAPFLAGALLDGWYAPSLRQDANSGLGRWSEPEIVQFLKTGRNKHAVVYGSMTEAFNNSTQFMADEDLAAIARYLKSLPGDPQRDGTPWQYQAVSAATRLDSPGAHTYVTRCASCHGLDGQGQAEWMPPLAGATSALAKENASAINITLNGSQRVVAAGVPDAYRMPAFREQLSDREIAEVLTFVRGTWGNQGGAVDAQAVGKLRGHTDPASSSPIILHMR
ncbi:c-type cytochrome [Pseudomonas chlororaphis]|jgi:mono/diheme cytochrome c family protein|uniref:Diheme cytochrome c-553 n=1 Tax=Pseudomonas chlororaphis subsp. aureofaciens TaxID=587851 RepID=A0AAD1E6B9_9PSED|nr:cytochrome c [Pseudomonas chlororaphis]AZE23603.1 Putative diheme cytochrome c-553 [Pseudomonas chlororaphis subsp. aureofaciens]AZE29898.1 Putative diheme cytochrome c-553 [Pseudomonas chlororaphis subsp. aureofaciens]AZE36201.1 Putative diheme cytochrome c-553 [Pseudomonas chlororaphis subsp. aureofaciens]AZE42544.1 Putative diheme cytochrome c-553 [Pseudomonas chlororaphis subsp. aureofaciens]QHC89694.1 alcohol dehydrogenase [Pseudomonas chlororaphis]